MIRSRSCSPYWACVNTASHARDHGKRRQQAAQFRSQLTRDRRQREHQRDRAERAQRQIPGRQLDGALLLALRPREDQERHSNRHEHHRKCRTGAHCRGTRAPLSSKRTHPIPKEDSTAQRMRLARCAYTKMKASSDTSPSSVPAAAPAANAAP